MDNEAETSFATPARQSVRERLAAAKAALPATISTTLPVSGLAVIYPSLLSHDSVMNAAKIAGKKNKHAVAKIIVAQNCMFEGERLTAGEIGTLLDNRDVTHLTDLLLGKDDDEDEADGEGGEGN